jgi:hypothetical protein
VSIYADGPTRVLCFSDERRVAAAEEDESSALNLGYRLSQVGPAAGLPAGALLGPGCCCGGAAPGPRCAGRALGTPERRSRPTLPPSTAHQLTSCAPHLRPLQVGQRLRSVNRQLVGYLGSRAQLRGALQHQASQLTELASIGGTPTSAAAPFQVRRHCAAAAAAAAAPQCCTRCLPLGPACSTPPGRHSAAGQQPAWLARPSQPADWRPPARPRAQGQAFNPSLITSSIYVPPHLRQQLLQPQPQPGPAGSGQGSPSSQRHARTQGAAAALPTASPFAPVSQQQPGGPGGFLAQPLGQPRPSGTGAGGGGALELDSVLTERPSVAPPPGQAAAAAAHSVLLGEPRRRAGGRAGRCAARGGSVHARRGARVLAARRL